PNGDVLPCCATDVPLVFGNVRRTCLKDVWNSTMRKEFLCKQLHGASEVPVCNMCSVPSYGLQQGDYLDGYEDELLERIGNQL
ncbi:MAG: SPASM domain-containing protein, partial [Oscillospiraceae bacterium]|nr:SPASM domain-containing protein [Oscillospiraceae bacterium]